MQKQNSQTPSGPVTTETVAGSGKPASANQLAEFAKLIAQPQTDVAPKQAEEQQPAADDQQPAKGTKPQGKKAKPKDFAELASALGVDAKELYAISVPSSRDGAEPYTLGKLKDFAETQDQFAIRELQLEERTRKSNGEIIKAQQELQELMAALPKDAIKPEVRAKLQAKRDAALVLERQRVLALIPEWENKETRTAEMAEMVDHLKEFGFDEMYLTTVMDHRSLNYIRGNMRREKLIRAALERVTEQKTPTPGKSKQNGAAPSKANGAQQHASREAQQASKFGQALFGSKS